MKKSILLLVILAFLLVFGPEPAHAASELETWCLRGTELTWDSGTSTCTIPESLSYPLTGVGVSEELAILPGETIDNYGSLFNHSTIHNRGTINNNYEIYNEGIIIIPPKEGGSGIINNTNNGYFVNYGVIRSRRIINNDGRIINRGIIHAQAGTITNNGSIGNTGTIILGEMPKTTNGYAPKTTNYDAITNNGTIGNWGVIYTYVSTITNNGTITNWGAIKTGGFIDNTGTIENYGSFWNGGTIFNKGIIYNHCQGSFTGNPPRGNPIIRVCFFEVFLPVIHADFR